MKRIGTYDKYAMKYETLLTVHVSSWSGIMYNSRIYSRCWDRQAWANSVDPDQITQNAVSDLGIHGLPTSSNFRYVDGNCNRFVQVLGEAW